MKTACWRCLQPARCLSPGRVAGFVPPCCWSRKSWPGTEAEHPQLALFARLPQARPCSALLQRLQSWARKSPCLEALKLCSEDSYRIGMRVTSRGCQNQEPLQGYYYRSFLPEKEGAGKETNGTRRTSIGISCSGSRQP